MSPHASPPPPRRPVPPAPGAILLDCLDLHTEGEPLRVILSGFPLPEGDTVLARRRDARARLDHLRRALLWEPRGHADMYGALVVPPERPDSDFGVLFLHNDGYSTMCGHGVLALARAAVETRRVPVQEPETVVTMDTPAGQVRARVDVRDGRIGGIRFRNVPSWAADLDAVIQVPGLGTVRYDLAYGGAFYAYVEAGALGLELTPGEVSDLVAAGRSIKAAIQGAAPPHHPGDPELGFLYGVIFTGPPSGDAPGPPRHSRHVCVFADGEVDRSPTGTGVSGRLALLHARGSLGRHEDVIIESILGTRFRCRILDTVTTGGTTAVVPEVEGRCWVTGWSTFHLDPDDPLREGFLLR
ncbi:MAG: proline racemase family protein [Gemmatimonadota bacterium]